MTDPAGLLVTPVGFDAGGVVRPLLLGSDGSVLVSGPSPSFLDPTPQLINFVNLSLPAGASTQIVATVPAGELWRLTTFEMHYVGTVAGVTLKARVFNLTTTMPFLYAGTVVSNVPITIVLDILLSAGMYVDVVVTGATLNDDLNANTFAQQIG